MDHLDQSLPFRSRRIADIASACAIISLFNALRGANAMARCVQTVNEVTMIGAKLGLGAFHFWSCDRIRSSRTLSSRRFRGHGRSVLKECDALVRLPVDTVGLHSSSRIVGHGWPSDASTCTSGLMTAKSSNRKSWRHYRRTALVMRDTGRSTSRFRLPHHREFQRQPRSAHLRDHGCGWAC